MGTYYESHIKITKVKPRSNHNMNNEAKKLYSFIKNNRDVLNENYHNDFPDFGFEELDSFLELFEETKVMYKGKSKYSHKDIYNHYRIDYEHIYFRIIMKYRNLEEFAKMITDKFPSLEVTTISTPLPWSDCLGH